MKIYKFVLLRWRFLRGVWSIGRTTIRTRMAVCRMRMRITIHRTRIRTSGLGLTTENELVYYIGDVSPP
ncbi:MAG: hypothetical protein SNI70_09580 [Rikenellaceae bacterium]